LVEQEGAYLRNRRRDVAAFVSLFMANERITTVIICMGRNNDTYRLVIVLFDDVLGELYAFLVMTFDFKRSA
jgi:hypothetical protein